MSSRARIAVAVALAVALFALIIGGFFWPRPQMNRGPWAGPDTAAPADVPPGAPRR